MYDIEKALLDRINKQIDIVQLHDNQPEDVKGDQMWIMVQSYNIGYLHALRYVNEVMVQSLAKQASKEKPTA